MLFRRKPGIPSLALCIGYCAYAFFVLNADNGDYDGLRYNYGNVDMQSGKASTESIFDFDDVDNDKIYPCTYEETPNDSHRGILLETSKLEFQPSASRLSNATNVNTESSENKVSTNEHDDDNDDDMDNGNEAKTINLTPTS
jgi:hypothetical protein